MTFHPCENLDQVLEVALEGGLAALERQAISDNLPKKLVRKPRAKLQISATA